METDQVYGHRHDVEGFHGALREIDAAVGEWLGLLRDDDLLVLTADHGVDPRAPHTDHTREYAPLLATFAGQDGRRHDGPLADVGASVLQWLAAREPQLPAPRSPGPYASCSARAPRGRDDPPPARAPRRGARRRAPGDRRPALVPAAGARGDRRRGAGPPRASALARRGKYLVWELEDEAFLLMHLRMTGTLLYDPPPGTPYERVRWVLDDGHELRFCDPRRFGTGELALGRAARDAFFAARLGLEPLDGELTGEALRRMARGRRAPVKAFLLDQRRIAGVGNIYADEALFRARIHPLRAAGSAHARAVRRAGADGARRAAGRPRGRGRDDRRLPPRRRRPGRLPERVPRPPAPRASRARGAATAVVKFVAAGRGTYACETLPAAPAAPAR